MFRPNPTDQSWADLEQTGNERAPVRVALSSEWSGQSNPLRSWASLELGATLKEDGGQSRHPEPYDPGSQCVTDRGAASEGCDRRWTQSGVRCATRRISRRRCAARQAWLDLILLDARTGAETVPAPVLRTSGDTRRIGGPTRGCRLRGRPDRPLPAVTSARRAAASATPVPASCWRRWCWRRTEARRPALRLFLGECHARFRSRAPAPAQRKKLRIMMPLPTRGEFEEGRDRAPHGIGRPTWSIAGPTEGLRSTSLPSEIPSAVIRARRLPGPVFHRRSCSPIPPGTCWTVRCRAPAARIISSLCIAA